MILSKLAISQVSDTEYELVDVPEWGEGAQVRVRNLYGDQRQRLNDSNQLTPHWNALCAAMGMVDDQGSTLFTEAEAAQLAKKHPAVIARIAEKIVDISTMTKASRVAAEKKLQTTPTNNGGTSSPEPSTPAMDSTSMPSSEPPEATSSSDGKPPTE